MKHVAHYNVKLDTFARAKKNGEKCVCLMFLDRDINQMDCYPIPLDVAEDLGSELMRLVKEIQKP